MNEGKLSEERIDESVRRLLRDKFTLGLFEDPYVDADKALSITTTEEKQRLAEEAQVKSTVVLKIVLFYPYPKEHAFI